MPQMLSGPREGIETLLLFVTQTYIKCISLTTDRPQRARSTFPPTTTFLSRFCEVKKESYDLKQPPCVWNIAIDRRLKLLTGF